MTLLERLAQATGPDRELDREIGVLVGAQHCGGVWNATRNDFDLDYEPYTGSVDAASTLVDPERWWLVNTGARQKSARAMVDTGKDWESAEAHGATPAIALTIAALKARGIE